MKKSFEVIVKITLMLAIIASTGSFVHAADDAPPTVTVTSIGDDIPAYTGLPVEIYGDAYDNVAVASVFVRLTDLETNLVWNAYTYSWNTGSTTWNRATLSATGRWSLDFNPPNGTYGTYMVTVIAFDSSHNMGVSGKPHERFTIRPGVSSPPEVSVSFPVDEYPTFTKIPVELSGLLNSEAQIRSVLVRITDLDSGLVWDDSGRQWKPGSTSWNPVTSFNQQSWTYDFNPVGVSNGVFMVTVIAYDTANRLGVSPVPQKQFVISNAIEPVAAVFEGGSLMYGAGAIHGLNDFPTQLCGELTPEEAYKCNNSGAGGAKVSHLIADGPTKIDPLVTSDNLLIVWVGTNDLFQSGNAIDMYEGLEQYISERQAAGWRVAVLTLPFMNVTQATTGEQAESERLAFNSLIRSNDANADLVIDIDGIPELQDWSDSQYRTADGIHFMPAGYALIAELTRPHVVAQYR